MNTSFDTLSKRRVFFLTTEITEPTSLEISIDGKKYSDKISFLPQNGKTIIYKFLVYPHEYGYKTIKIQIISGSLKITEDSGRVLYPGFFSKGFHNKIKYQSNYINWFYSTTNKLGVKYLSNSVVKFKHLYVSGPNFIDKNEKNQFLYTPLMDPCKLDRDSITKKLLQS